QLPQQHHTRRPPIFTPKSIAIMYMRTCDTLPNCGCKHKVLCCKVKFLSVLNNSSVLCVRSIHVISIHITLPVHDSNSVKLLIKIAFYWSLMFSYFANC